jgi:phospholipid/cholesterol/gamma-HCH transport system ATP-binding protein
MYLISEECRAEMEKSEPHIVVQDLTVAYGNNVILHDLTFTVNRGDIFIIMGESGGGKSTVLRSMIGLLPPTKGQILYDGLSFWSAEPEEQKSIMRKFGILYQSGALWSSFTLAENVALPLQQYTELSPHQIKELVVLKLALVGLAGFEEYYPSEISGGMKKRAGLARAMALDPDILFFDEPSAGLDPISAHLLDELIIELRNSLGATIVIVTHELASIFAIGSNSVFLDDDKKTMIAGGEPRKLLTESKDPKVIDFLTRGKGRARK